MIGPLDQGFWPDGIYAAPTDEALKYDIEMTKKLGYNMARKHVKVEPDRWYYWADKLGLLVWQDMPSGDRSIGPKQPDLVRSPESAKQYDLELQRMIDGRRNHPSIIMWVVFNEGWGQFDTPRVTNWVKEYDPSRLVNCASGWTDRGVGDVHDIHVYPGPGTTKPEEHRAAVLGEFGGLGLPLEGHTWQSTKNWGYRKYNTRDEVTKAYLSLMDHLQPEVADPGMSAAVYTQTTDVETEVNGLMTYDREIVKPDEEQLAAAHRKLFEAAAKEK
jgi:beta-galactosidase/beta-glucuronidase